MKVFSVHEVLAATQKKLRDAEAERDALAAQLESFVDVLMNSENIDKATKELISGIWSCRATPQQCLRDVQAEAGRKGYLEAALNFDPDYDAWWSADQYAESVRKGGAE